MASRPPHAKAYGDSESPDTPHAEVSSLSQLGIALGDLALRLCVRSVSSG